MRTVLLACLFGAIIVFSSHSGAHGADSVHSEGYIVDVVVIDLQCDENHTCISKPTNVVEYFGADWCSECPEVEQQLQETSNQSALIISHRPSSIDDYWLQASRDRFLDVYGLWGYPTLTIDGHYILAGPTQSRELNTLLSDSVSNYSGISNLTLENNILNLSGDLDGLMLDAWTVRSTQNLTNMVVNHTNLSETNVVGLNGDKLVIVISQPGFIKLVSGSSLPANDYIPDGGLNDIGENSDSVRGSTIIIITILLLIITLPATYQLLAVMKSPISEQPDSLEEKEITRRFHSTDGPNIVVEQKIITNISDSVIMGNVSIDSLENE
ncbi:MAG: hypothetical protein HOE76_06055 [Euryarchaeota archaeon]|jgi:hypothetical protein|nr:hypothetical protein [Euryarchaeota archaeon]